MEKLHVNLSRDKEHLSYSYLDFNNLSNKMKAIKDVGIQTDKYIKK